MGSLSLSLSSSPLESAIELWAIIGLVCLSFFSKEGTLPPFFLFQKRADGGRAVCTGTRTLRASRRVDARVKVIESASCSSLALKKVKNNERKKAAFRFFFITRAKGEAKNAFVMGKKNAHTADE